MSKPDTSRCAAPIPANTGIGLRGDHYREILADQPKLGWLEVHSENYFGRGGTPHRYLTQIRETYPISLHGVGLSLGSTDPLNVEHLQRLKELIAQYEPGLVSEHVSWSSAAGRYLNDLLPLPYTEEALNHFIDRVSQTQDYLGRQILIENASTYLQFEHSTIPEWEFVREAAERTGCGILFDVNNIYVNSVNHGFDPQVFLDAIPANLVHEIHLAGHTKNTFDDGDILIDTHNQLVCQAVWDLYDRALEQLGAIPTLIEWDTDLPPLSVLLDEAHRAQTYMENRHARVA